MSIFLLFTGIFILVPHVFEHDVDGKLLTIPGHSQLVSLLVPDNTHFHLTHKKVTSLNLLDLKETYPKLPSYYQIKSALLKKFVSPFWGLSNLYQLGYTMILWLSCPLGRGTFTSLSIGNNKLSNSYDVIQLKIQPVIPNRYWYEARKSNENERPVLFEEGFSIPLSGRGVISTWPSHNASSTEYHPYAPGINMSMLILSIIPIIPKQYWYEGKMSNDSGKPEMFLCVLGFPTFLTGRGLISTWPRHNVSPTEYLLYAPGINISMPILPVIPNQYRFEGRMSNDSGKPMMSLFEQGFHTPLSGRGFISTWPSHIASFIEYHPYEPGVTKSMLIILPVILEQYWYDGRMCNESGKPEMFLCEQGFSTPLSGRGPISTWLSHNAFSIEYCLYPSGVTMSVLIFQFITNVQFHSGYYEAGIFILPEFSLTRNIFIRSYWFINSSNDVNKISHSVTPIGRSTMSSIEYNRVNNCELYDILKYSYSNTFEICINFGLRPNMHAGMVMVYRYLPLSIVLSKKQYQIIQHPGKKATFFLGLLLLMLSGDCEQNPGPSPDQSSCSRFPCEIYHEPCTWSQQAIQCDECDCWYHGNCMDVNSVVYQALGNSNISWICVSCGVPNFSTSLFSQWSVNLSNTFSSLEKLPDEGPLSPPMAQSSPKGRHQPSGKSSKKPTSRNYKPLKVIVVNFGSIKNKVADLAACN